MSSNMDKGKYWEEYNAWEEYNDSYLYPERNEKDLDAIINSVLNGGKFEENTPKSYDNFECFWEDVTAFAEQYRLPVSYVEEEFVIEGELIAVHLNYPEDPLS